MSTKVITVTRQEIYKKIEELKAQGCNIVGYCDSKGNQMSVADMEEGKRKRTAVLTANAQRYKRKRLGENI
jgi:hypothetical protein